MDIYALQTEELQNDLFSDGLSMSMNGKEFLANRSCECENPSSVGYQAGCLFLGTEFRFTREVDEKSKISVEELSKYPEVKRDLALLVDSKVTFAALREVAFATERKLLKKCFVVRCL